MNEFDAIEAARRELCDAADEARTNGVIVELDHNDYVGCAGIRISHEDNSPVEKTSRLLAAIDRYRKYDIEQHRAVRGPALREYYFGKE